MEPRFRCFLFFLPPPPRTESRHRRYSDDHFKRLIFIRHSRQLGFTLDDIRSLLGLVTSGYTCDEVKGAALAHRKDIRQKSAASGGWSAP